MCVTAVNGIHRSTCGIALSHGHTMEGLLSSLLPRQSDVPLMEMEIEETAKVITTIQRRAKSLTLATFANAKTFLFDLVVKDYRDRSRRSEAELAASF